MIHSGYMKLEIWYIHTLHLDHFYISCFLSPSYQFLLPISTKSTSLFLNVALLFSSLYSHFVSLIWETMLYFTFYHLFPLILWLSCSIYFSTRTQTYSDWTVHHHLHRTHFIYFSVEVIYGSFLDLLVIICATINMDMIVSLECEIYPNTVEFLCSVFWEVSILISKVVALVYSQTDNAPKPFSITCLAAFFSFELLTMAIFTGMES